jgi:hypothetical protein
MIRHSIIAVSTVLACAHAAASGGGAYDRFVNRGATDIPLNLYQAGTLGVVLPSYERMYLYAAWRSVDLGDQIKTAPNPPGGLLRALGSRTGGWYDSGGVAEAYDPWVAQVNAVLKPAPAPKGAEEPPKFYYLNCPAASYAFATKTLSELAKRGDATPARLSAWVASQQQVFKICGDDPLAQRQPYDDGKPRPVVPMPKPLPATEALYWRQMQQYQLASAAFYGDDYAASQRQFSEIGATEGHPLRNWGAYLALRAQLRAALATKPDAATTPAQKLAAMQAGAARILRDPALADLHESTRALMRSAQARVTPEARFTELGKLLDDPRTDPYLEDHLGDWRVLANQFLAEPASKDQQPLMSQFRKNTGFVDWIATVQACAVTRDKQVCKQQQPHAVEVWRRYSTGKGAAEQAQARVWLLAVAMLSDAGQGLALPADAEQAAVKVAAGAPEYLTLRLALTRHYRMTKQDAKARATAEAVLAGAPLASARTGARNQFLQERFAVATSPADAAPYLLRAVGNDLDPDTGEVAPRNADGAPPAVPGTIAADGLRWLNQGLATADLLALGSNSALDAPVRTRIALAAWMRADLLQQPELATQAAQLAGRTTPALAPLMQQYLSRKTAAERRHRMLVNAVKYGFSPVVRVWDTTDPGLPRGDDDMLADLWCKFTSGDADWDTGVEESPPRRDTGNIALRDQELGALGKLKTATGFVGDHVMRRAAEAPDDPDLPWLLHVVVMSTRGGCLDADSHTLSKNAFTLLHKRFKYSPWAGKTPYFY